MLYGAIAEKLRRVAEELNALASEMERIQAAAPAVQVPTITEPAKLTYTVPEAADLLNVSRPTMYTLANREDFPAIHIGKRIVIPRDKFIEWINYQAEIRGEF